MGVYVIGRADRVDNLFKIGHAQNIKKRLNQIQVSFPYVLEVFAEIPGGYEDEVAIHKQFNHVHVRGEWFRLTSDDIYHLVVDERERLAPLTEWEKTIGRMKYHEVEAFLAQSKRKQKNE